MTPPTADELKAFRQSQGGISQVKLAEQLGVSRRNVEDWEAGKSAPPAYLRLALGALDARADPWEPRADPGRASDIRTEIAQLSQVVIRLTNVGVGEPLSAREGAANRAQIDEARAKIEELSAELRALG